MPPKFWSSTAAFGQTSRFYSRYYYNQGPGCFPEGLNHSIKLADIYTILCVVFMGYVMLDVIAMPG